MTQKDKELILKDLCGRLPYGVKVQHQHEDYLDEIQTIERISRRYGEIETESVLGFVDDFKPYLRSMSSMTEEELYEVQEILGKGVEVRDEFIVSVDSSIDSFTYLELQAVFDWLNKNMFDYRGLIRMGLALEAPEGMYN